MKTIKCQRCGNEFNNSIYPFCPECFRKPTIKERVIDYLWGCVSSICVISIFVFAGFGIEYKLFDNALLPIVVLFILFGVSISKIYEMKKDKIMTRLKKELQKVESENNPWLINEITKAVENELKFL